MTYVPVTVGRRTAGFTVTRGPRPTFTVTGHPGGLVTVPATSGTVTAVDTAGVLTLAGTGVTETAGTITLTGTNVTETNGIITIS